MGGTANGARNVISGNGNAGVSIQGADADDNTVQGNLLGTELNGTTPLANRLGVFISEASDNTVGGAISDAANVIAGNEIHGVQIIGASAVGNSVLRNSIIDNGLMGIELNGDGVSPNDRRDRDTGSNGIQNFPVITSATTTRIEGTLSSRPRRVFTIQLFLSPTASVPAFFTEGETFIKEVSVRTNRKGKASFATRLDSGLPVGQVVTATATDPGGSTSEFSASREVG